MFWVHLLSMKRNVFTNDGSFAFSTRFRWRCDTLLPVLFAQIAVNVTIFLFIGLANQILATTSAGKVLRMVLVPCCRHAFICDRLFAVDAARTEEFIKVGFAIGLFFMLNEWYSSSEWLVAVDTNKVFWMVGLAQRIYNLSNHHFSTSSTRRASESDRSAIRGSIC